MSTLIKADATGAVTLPAEFCRGAGIAPDADLLVEIQSGRIVLVPARPPLWEKITARARSLPKDALDPLPGDLAAEHDHYLYGAPRRQE